MNMTPADLLVWESALKLASEHRIIPLIGERITWKREGRVLQAFDSVESAIMWLRGYVRGLERSLLNPCDRCKESTSANAPFAAETPAGPVGPIIPTR